MATPNPEQIKILEQSRQRLVQLTRSLGSLAASLNSSDPLPSWSSLQSQASIISNNLLSAAEQLSEHRDLLSSLVAYPGPEYPSRTQASTLEQLLRTKLDPRVEDWVNRGRTGGMAALEGRESLSESELAELWEWAPLAANQEARRRDWGGNFTLEEREMGIQNVVTGLRRQLEDDEIEDEDQEEGEEDEEEEAAVDDVARGPSRSGVGVDGGAVPTQKALTPLVPVNDVLRYMTTGQLPA